MRRRAFRIAATVLLAIGVVTCTDAPTGPHKGGGAARLAIVPSFDAGAQRALAGLAAAQVSVASVRVQIQRPPDQSLVDTSVVFPPGADSLVLALTVRLNGASEQLQADVQLRDASGNILFEGKSTITASVGAGGSTVAAPVKLSYVGPGSGTASLLVSPQAFTLTVGHQTQFFFTALDSAGKVVNNVPVNWKSSALSVATVDEATGLATAVAPGTTSIQVKALNGVFATAALTVVNPPSKVQVVSGDAQKAPAGSATLQPFTVLVTNADGVAVPNVPVTFRSLDASASVNPASAATDASGRASTVATVGTKAGPYAFEAGVTGLTAVRVTDTATAGAAAQIAVVSGDAQRDTAGKALSKPLVTKVTDKYGNAAPKATVSWTHTGGGSLSATSTTTDTAGLASVTYTLGAKASTDTVRAQLAGVSGGAGTASFVETATPRAPASLVIVSGNGQIAAAGTLLGSALTVNVLDDHGTGVGGATVSWLVTSGTGSLSSTRTVADSLGRASVTLVAGRIAGAIGVTAAVDGTTIHAVFSETSLPGPASVIAKQAGDGQSATVGTAVSIAPSVKVTDSFGNAVSGVAVTFAVASGGGSVTGATATTNASGVATVGSWTLGTTAGANTLTATAGALSVTFNATATSGAFTKLAFGTTPSASAQSGAALATQPTLKLQDSYGNAVAQKDVNITASVSSGASVTAGGSATTDATGTATFSGLTSSGTAGSYTLTFTSGSTTVTSALTLAAGSPSQMTALSATALTVTAGAAVPTASLPSVQVKDASGNAVSGVSVTFSGSSVGALTGATATTNASGTATLGGWTPPTAVGSYTLTASAGALSVTFTATVQPGAAAQMTKSAGDGQSATAGSAVATAPSVKITDASGNAISGETVTFVVASGGGSVTGGTATTNASGVATVGSWTLGNTAGANTLTATDGALSVTFTATGQAGPLHHLGMVTQPATTATSGVAMSTQPSVRLQDQYNNPISTLGVQVVASVSGGSSAVASHDTVATDAAGLATFTSLTVTGATGSFTLTFQATGAQPATSIGISLGAGAAASVAAVGSTALSDSAGTSVAPTSLPSVLVKDAGGNRISGVSVAFAAASGSSISADGSTYGSTFNVTTNASGVAALKGWKFPTTSGSTQVTATATGLSGSPVTFGATVTPASAHELLFDTQPVNATSQSSMTITVSVRDEFHNTITSGTGASDTVAIALSSAAGATLAATSGSLATKATSGVATFHASVDKVGSYTLVARARGRDSVVSTSFTISAGTAKHTAVVSGNSQPGSVGVELSQPLWVAVTDASGNTVSGATVKFEVTSGGGTLSTPATTNSSGQTSVTWRLGSGGIQSVRAYVTEASAGDTAYFSAGLPGVATSIGFVTAPEATPASGDYFSRQPVLQLYDGSGSPVTQSGVEVTASVTAIAAFRSPFGAPTLSRSQLRPGPGSGPSFDVIPNPTLIGTVTATTDANGKATFSHLGAAGMANKSFTVTFTTSTSLSVNTTITMHAGHAKHVKKGSVADGEYVAYHRRAHNALAVLVTDSVGNAVADSAVKFVADSGGSLGAATARSDATGSASVPAWTMGNSGPNHLRATVDGADTVQFTAYAMKPAKLVLLRSQTAGTVHGSGNALGRQPQIGIVDSLGNQLEFDGISVAVHPRLHGGGVSANLALRGDTIEKSDATGAATYSSVALHGAAGTKADLLFTAVDSSDGTVVLSSITDATGDSVAAGGAATMSNGASSKYRRGGNGSSRFDVDSIKIVDGSLFTNPVKGFTGFAFGRTGSHCTSGGVSVSTDANGIAVDTIQVDSTTASCQVTLSAGSLAGSGVTRRHYTAPSGSAIWVGDTDNGWSKGSNWLDGTVPSGTDAFIPAYAGNSPQLSSAGSTGALRMESGSSLDLHGNTLNVNGDAAVDGSLSSSVGGSQVVLQATTANVRGSFPGKLSFGGSTCGSLTLSGAVSADSISATCKVTVGRNSLTSRSWLKTSGSGAISMTDSSGSVSVATDADLSGARSTMTNGSFTANGNVTIGSAGLATDTLNTFQINGSAAATLTIAQSSTTSFGSLTINNTSSSGLSLNVVSGAALTVNQDLSLGDNVNFTIPTTVTMTAKNVKLGNNAKLTVNGSGNARSCKKGNGATVHGSVGATCTP